MYIIMLTAYKENQFDKRKREKEFRIIIKQFLDNFYTQEKISKIF